MAVKERPQYLVPYHHPCSDGFAAAVIAKSALGDKAECVAISYDKIPELDVKGRDVIAFDVFLGRERIEGIKAQAKSFVSHDHHAWAHKQVYDLSYCKFDMAKSGATLAWNHFHPKKPVPELYQQIQDFDSRQFKLPESKAVRAYIQRYLTLSDMQPWMQLQHDMEDKILRNRVVEEGQDLLKKDEILVSGYARPALKINVGPYQGYMVTVQGERGFYGAMVADHLAEKARNDGLPGALGVTWRILADNADIVKGSVRSGDVRVDCSFVAEKLLGGGGGHPDAGGITLPTDKWLKKLKEMKP